LARTTVCSLLALTLWLTGCFAGRPAVIVGSKNFTEQNLLGEIIAQHLENRLHLPIERRLNLGGTMLAQSALLNKEIDLYPEYTGTAFTNILHHTGVSDPGVVLERVRAEYQESMNLTWLDPLGFDNKFALAIRGKDARERNLQTLSDAAADTSGFVLGAGYEFLQRPDGFGLLNQAYNLHWIGGTKSMDLGLLYTALEQNRVSMIAGSETDGPLSVLDVKVLKDDKQAFPPYQACIVVRTAKLNSSPKLRAALTELSGKLTTEKMRQLNYLVDGKHQAIQQVAKDFLGSVVFASQ
jgi:osmoprotectant transport system substrate-binding protein